jgi:hypothetical protein
MWNGGGRRSSGGLFRSSEGSLCLSLDWGRLGPTKDSYVRYCGVGVRLPGWLPG